jgi:hypothetical protein
MKKWVRYEAISKLNHTVYASLSMYGPTGLAHRRSGSWAQALLASWLDKEIRTGLIPGWTHLWTAGSLPLQSASSLPCSREKPNGPEITTNLVSLYFMQTQPLVTPSSMGSAEERRERHCTRPVSVRCLSSQGRRRGDDLRPG